MANDIQIGRLSGVLHKLLDMKEGAPAPVLGAEILATLPLEVDRPEWAFLGGERWCAGQFNDAGVVAEYSMVGLMNPADSGVLGVLERIRIGAWATGQFYVLLGGAGSVTPDAYGSAYAIDMRSRSAPTVLQLSTCRVFNFTGATAGTIVQTNRTLINETGDVSLPVVLDPGSFVAIRGAVVNQGFDADFVWRERALIPSEER